jgi:acetyl esterase/lipase
LDAGFSVVTVAHRPVNETNHWPAPANDVARAIQFIRARATDWGIDPDRLAVKGRSSGGHVALMAGFGPDRAKPGSPDPVERQSSRPDCIIAGSAPTDLGLQMTELLKEENRPGLRREALRDGNSQDYLWERMCALLGIKRAGLTVDELARRLGPLSPVHVVTRDAPPVLLLHPGPADAFWPGDARLKWDVHTPITGLILAQRLKELGVPHELAMLPEGSEGRGGGVVSPQELAFLRRHLRTGDSAQPLASKQALPAPPAANSSGQDAPARQAELAKWDAADAHRSQTGPGGSEWDGPYRSFIQTDENAVAKGFPTHAEAARQIKEDAAKSREALAKHLGWVLFIKHFSQAYRPESATADLKRLYEDLADLKLGGDSRSGGRGKNQEERGKPGAPFDGDPRLVIHREVVYGKTHPEIQKLDAYLVKSEQPTPVVIEIHGGGWRRGSKSQFVYPGDLVGTILGAGISVVSIDYRLSPRHTMPASMEDVVRAVQFVRSKAREWNLDPNRMAALGGSAGAHLGAWVALHDDLARPDSADPVERQSSRLTCFVALWGPMDLTRVRPTQLAQQPLRGQDFANAFTAAFGCTAEQYEQDPAVRQRIRDASPVFLASSNDPPAFVMARWSEDLAVLRDPPVPAVINDPHSAWHSVLLAEALVKTGGTVVRRIGSEVGKNPEADVATILSFLRQQLLSVSMVP